MNPINKLEKDLKKLVAHPDRNITKGTCDGDWEINKKNSRECWLNNSSSQS